MTDPSDNDPTLIRGTCVEVAGAGVLLRGAAGAGKSDLALRLIEDGAGLVSDDYVTLRRDGDVLRATAPAPIAGLLEVRGVGVVQMPRVGETALRVVIDLVAAAEVPRLPEAQAVELLGVALPQVALCPFEASAPAKIRTLVRALSGCGFRPERFS